MYAGLNLGRSMEWQGQAWAAATRRKGPGGAPSGKNVFFVSASDRTALVGSRLKPEQHTETREVLAAKIDSPPTHSQIDLTGNCIDLDGLHYGV